jgi:ParB-like chromosome segregation protein Spo0J
VETVPILSVLPGDSPRLNGEDRAHIARLAEMETALPPILVDRRTMRVIDGMHRLMAASLQGRDTIQVQFFEGSAEDIFLRAVEANVTHGLPLSQSDRRSAAERIIATHPHMSDRAIGEAAGLAAKTVAAIRKRSIDHVPQSNTRVGRDGRVRPLDSSEARRRAAELLTSQPEASLRDVARAAGISPATVLDVRNRLARGESPTSKRSRPAVTGGSGRGGATGTPGANGTAGGAVAAAAPARPALAPVPGPRPGARLAAAPDAAATVEKLLRDPSLRNNDQGKEMLRLLHINAVSADQLPDVAAVVPAHCVTTVGELARQYARMWQDFAQELNARARIIDPSAVVR